MVSNKKNNKSAIKHEVQESDDEFDKLIGHIEGSRIESKVNV